MPDSAERTARRAIAAAALLVLAAAIAVVANRNGDSEPSPVVEAPATAGIGPGAGTAIAGYLTGREQALDAVGDDDVRVAVASFTRYRTVTEASAVVSDAGLDRSVTVLARIVAAPGGDPAVVTGSLDDWASALRTTAEADRSQIEQILPTVEPGSEFVAFYQRELVRLAAVRDGAKADGPVVFALVVRAKGSALRALAARAEVRAVDPGAERDLVAGAVYTGLLPDDATTTGNPPQRPVPSS